MPREARPLSSLISAYGHDVNHSKISYYAELFLYPIVVAALLLFDLASNGLDRKSVV